MQVYEDERAMMGKSDLVGKFDFSNIPPRNVPQFKVSFGIAETVVPNVTEVNKSSSKRNDFAITLDKELL